MPRLLLLLLLAVPAMAMAAPLAAPGDLRLRHDLQLLNDSGVINIPLAAWPLALGDIHAALESAEPASLRAAEQAALERVRHHLSWELETDVFTYRLGLAGAENPRVIRGFEHTPREEGELSAGFSWLGDRFVVNLAASYVSDPFDGDELRPDGTYVGVVLGNWIMTAGWQERWWGHGRDSSLILSTNARPTPGLAVQRNISRPFKFRWLRWMGPWTFAGFLAELDDERTVNNARLFGVRGSFRPPNTGLEIGISRTAQWCGDDRPCRFDTFADLLLGNDNQGTNVSPEDEPGNQLAGWDGRWTLPRQIPVALYMHWIGEDGRPNGFPLGSWMRQFGVEYWGSVGSVSHRTHIEASDTVCREGGFGFSDARLDCAYTHPIYKTGYRFRGRAIGHSADGNSLSYSIGSTLVQSAGHSWNISLRYMEINRKGAPDPRHSLTPTPQELIDLQLSHERDTRFGRFHSGIGFSRLDDAASSASSSEISAFIRWASN